MASIIGALKLTFKEYRFKKARWLRSETTHLHDNVGIARYGGPFDGIYNNSRLSSCEELPELIFN